MTPGARPEAAGAVADVAQAARPLDLVLVEDLESDAVMVLAELRRAGYDVRVRVVSTEPEFLMALYQPPEMVISDHSLPQFDGLRALELVASLDQEIPFILVSGTVSEELAVTALHRGASDYVPKDRLARLGPAVGRALELRQARIERRRAEAAIRASEARLRAILDNEPECVTVVAADGSLVEINRAGLAMLEADGIEQVRALGLLSFARPACRAKLAEELASVLAGQSRTTEFEIEGMRGTRRRMEMHAAPLWMPGQEQAQVLAVTRDVTAQRLAETHLLRLNRMHALLSGVNSLIVRAQRRDDLLRDACRLAAVQGEFALAWVGLVELETGRLRIAAHSSESGARAYTLPPALAIGAESDDFVERCVRSGQIEIANDLDRDAPGHAPSAGRGLGSAAALPLLSGGRVVGVMALYARAPGFFDEDEVRLLGDLAGDISFALAHIAMRESAEFVAMHDPLTGLPNRTLLVDRTQQALRAAARKGQSVAVVYLSVERFRLIAESLGRQMGDELMRRVAERLQAAARREDTLARAGERRFALLVAGISDPAEASTLLSERILRAFDSPVRVAGQDFRLRLKAGIAVGDATTHSADELCLNAERALRTARAGPARFTFHEPAMNARVAESLALERKLRLAVEGGELVLHYQPIVQAVSGRVTSLEALLRWNDPERGMIGPGDFIPVMEETGLIVEAGRWVMRRAADDIREWRRQGLRVPPVAINVSALQLRQDGFVDDLREALRGFAARERVLSIEITESVLVEGMEGTARKLAQLRDAGVGVGVDDFGTGYSCLAYVADLPIDSLKIDRSFVARLSDTGRGRSIVTTVVALGHAFGLRVVAEGAESAEDIRILTELGCDELQGFAIARPACAQDMAHLLAEQT